MKKVFIGLFVFVILIVGAVIAIPFIFKDKINEVVKTEINKQVNATIDYEGFDLSIIKSFPDFTFSLYDLSVLGVEDFEGDTLAKIEEIGLGMDLMSAINGEQIKIHSILLDGPHVRAYILPDSIANWDIMPESEVEDTHEGTQSALDISVESFELKNGTVHYGDFATNMEATVEGINIDAEVDYSGNVATLYSNSNIEKVSFIDGETAYLKEASIDLLLDLDADLDEMTFTLRENELGLNALKVNLDGTVAMPGDDIDMDLTFSADKSNFKELLSLVPPSYLKDFEGLEASGNFALSGFAKGTYNENSLPTFGLDLLVENGSVHYPDLPTSIEAINFTANVSSPTADMSQLAINVPKAHFEIENEPIDLSLTARNVMADPYIDLKAKGKFDLEKVPSFYPLEGVNQIDGNIDADITFKGTLSQVENEDFENIDFGGMLTVTDMIYDAVDMPMPLNMSILDVEFTPAYANLNQLQTQLGNSDFSGQGKLENVIGYALKDDATLTGHVDITSTKIDLVQLMTSGEQDSESTEEVTSDGTDEIIKVPANIIFDGKLQAEEILYDDITLSNVIGEIEVKDEALYLHQLAANLLGGKAIIEGSYNTKNVAKPIVAFSYDVQEFDIQESFNYVNTVQDIAPVAKYLIGMFSSDMELTGSLNPDLSLDMNSLTGAGRVQIPFATIKEIPAFKKIQETLKIPAFDNPKLENAWTVLAFEDGRVNVEPFDVKLKDMNMEVVGSNGFDASMDYVMKLTVPSDKFGGAADIANNFLASTNIPLFDMAIPNNMTFHLNLTGFMDDPKVKIAKVTADGSDQGIKDQIKDNVKDQLNDAKEDAKEQFEDAKEEVKENIEEAKEEIKEEVQQQVDDVKEDVKENIKDKLKGFGW